MKSIITLCLVLCLPAHAVHKATVTNATYFLCYGEDGTRHVMKAEAGQSIISGQPEFFASEADAPFLEKAAEIALSADFNPVPTNGQVVAKGIYSYNGGLIICRQNHVRTEHAIETIPALFSVYRGDADGMEWIANEPVKAGNVRVYSGVTYTCAQSHTTQVDWTPNNTPTLWTPAPADEILPWVQPTSVNPYNIGDKVLFGGNVYESLINANVWSPAAYPAGWKLVE